MKANSYRMVVRKDCPLSKRTPKTYWKAILHQTAQMELIYQMPNYYRAQNTEIAATVKNKSWLKQILHRQVSKDHSRRSSTNMALIPILTLSHLLLLRLEVAFSWKRKILTKVHLFYIEGNLPPSNGTTPNIANISANLSGNLTPTSNPRRNSGQVNPNELPPSYF